MVCLHLSPVTRCFILLPGIHLAGRPLPITSDFAIFYLMLQGVGQLREGVDISIFESKA